METTCAVSSSGDEGQPRRPCLPLAERYDPGPQHSYFAELAFVVIDAQDINDDGVITGEAQDRTTGAIYAFRAIPKWR